MSQHFSYRNLPQLLLRAREKLLGHFRPLITHFGLTEQQWRVLRAISEAGQLEPREICEICQILSPSLAGVLARMEDMGLVTRTRMEEDQRRVSVRITAQAQQLVEELSPLIIEQYHLIEQAYGRAMIAELYEVMDRFLTLEHGPIAQVPLPERGPDAPKAGRAR
ncbi:MAG: homoprotocatechuate degradation operon regulator HpaR [Proteobacteria bacterium]|nr:homoprotocatechuate degradation operon regulator HpaR [Pseudomonadota bacterium]